jgi:hypothetical protein
MLREDEDLYLVGHDTLDWWDGSAWAYHLPDALGPVRQETDGARWVKVNINRPASKAGRQHLTEPAGPLRMCTGILGHQALCLCRGQQAVVGCQEHQWWQANGLKRFMG